MTCGIAAVLFGGPAPQAGSAAVEVRVADAQGRPVEGAEVTLQGAGDTAPRTGRTDAHGKQRFADLRPGSYAVRAQQSGTAASGAVVLGEKETRQLELRFPAGPAFFDEPQFLVAGVTDSSHAGGHGSDTVLRSAEALTKAAAELSKGAPGPAAAEESLREAVAREPARAEWHHALAASAENAGDALLAAREYQRAAELDPSEANLFDWGTELLTHRAATPAVQVFGKGNRLFPRSTRMLLGLAVSWYSQGVYEQAAQRFLEACDLNPADPSPYLFLGKVRSPEILQSDAYLERMSRFARLFPESAVANYSYAASLWRRWQGPGDRPTAAKVEALLQKSVRLDPNLGSAWLQLGMVRFANQDTAGAIAAYQKALAASPGLEEAHYHLARAYARLGNLQQAKQELELHDRLSRQSSAEAERERGAIQDFVIQLRGVAPAH